MRPLTYDKKKNIGEKVSGLTGQFTYSNIPGTQSSQDIPKTQQIINNG